MARQQAFIFLCDQETEPECLGRYLVGSPQESAVWALSIQQGDDIYLFNYNTRVIRGPYSAVSNADCYERSAWRGKFPVQVKIAANTLTRIADGRGAGTPAVLSRRRPAHVLGAAAQEVFSWIQTAGAAIGDST
jgi:hypothetical protein